MTSLSAYEVTSSTTSCFLGMYACPATDGDFAAIFLTVNFPLITPGTPIQATFLVTSWQSSVIVTTCTFTYIARLLPLAPMRAVAC
jgi:hypothetical protein